ncbi:MAG: hypothetical protein IT470_06560 [Pseudomonadales bacterium]|nr:hypothetical protein [Pseudomonadales bacterium]
MVFWLLLTFFLSVTAYYIVYHHVSPLSRDQWHMYDALLQQGWWRTSITTVSGHRHLLAFLLYDIDLQWFAGNNQFLIAIDWLLNAGLITAVCWQIRRCVSDTASRYWLMGWTLLLLCWLLNIALLGWGFNGINNYLSILSTVLAILLLHRAVFQAGHTQRAMWGAVLLAGLATCSFGNGILVWPIGVVSLYLWRAPRHFLAIFFSAGLLFLGLYLLLPGGEAVGHALHLNGWKSLTFPVVLMGGPCYHLLRAWQVLSDSLLGPIASGVGVLVSLLAVLMLRQCWRRRERNDALDALALTMIMIGFGTALLLMLTRVEGVLDPAVDRFQIWALLVWLGASLLLYRSMNISSRLGWQLFFLLFPVLAFPAQLDWGARLAEYRTRVNSSLLAYQVYLPAVKDAERALHWNWQGKLPHLFPVLEYLRAHQRNIFADGAAAWLGKPVPSAAALPACQWRSERTELLRAADLLDVSQFASAQPYAVTAGTPEQVLGVRWYGALDAAAWDFGLIADQAGIVRGLLYPLRASLLPRASGWRHPSENAVGIARQAQTHAVLVVMREGEALCSASLQ